MRTLDSRFSLRIDFDGRYASTIITAALLLSGVNASAQGLSGIPQRLEEKVAVSFTGKVAGILTSRCGQCHVQGNKGEFRMSTFAELMKAPGVVTPGNSSSSALYSQIESGEMPPKRPMPKEEQDVIKRWIEQGAKFDGSNESQNLAAMSGGSEGSVLTTGPPANSGGPPSGSPDSRSRPGAPLPGYPDSQSRPGAPSDSRSRPGAPLPGYPDSQSRPGAPPSGSSDSRSRPGAPLPGYPDSGSRPGAPSDSRSRPGAPPGYPGGPESSMDAEMQMGMDDSMSSTDSSDMYSDGGAAGMYGAGAGSLSSEAMATYGSNLTSLLSSLDLSGLFALDREVTVQSGPVLNQDAEQAFLAGNQQVALELMYGHMATEFQDAIVAIQTAKYSPVLKKPVWNIRWGLSMYVRGDAVSDPKPIREGATPLGRVASRGAGGSRRGGMDSSMEMRDMGMQEDMRMQDDESPVQENLDQGMENMDMDESGSDYGTEMSQMRRGPGGPQGMEGRGPAFAPAAPKIPERKMLSDEVVESLDKSLGLVAKIVAEEFNKRFQQGDFGPVFSALVQTPAAVEEPNRNANAAAAAPAQVTVSAAVNDVLTEAGDPLYPMWQPGLVFLGEGPAEDMLAAAKRANLDLVIHFDVVLKAGRNETVQNISRVRLFAVSPPPDSQGKIRNLMVTSPGIDSFEARQMATAGRMDEREYVSGQLSSLFAIMDRDVKCVDLPALPVEVARRRVATIISGPEAHSLRTLAEVRLYEARELITQDEVEAAFDIVGGSEGLLLLYGPTKERVETVRKWATQAAATATPR